MILLTGSSSLRVYLGASVNTNQFPIVVTYLDSNSTTFNPLAYETQTNNTTPVIVVDPPASGLSRQLKYLSILNTDTITNDVYVEYHTPSNDRRVFKQALTTNQKIEYLDTEGFEVIPGAFINVTGDAVTGVPFITYGSTALLGNYRIAEGISGISTIDSQANAGAFSIGLSGNMYYNITGHTGDLSRHLTGLSVSNQLLDQTLVWNNTGWVNAYANSVVYATNAEATTLNIGEVVYLFGAQGDRASVKRASSTGEFTSSKTVGMVSQSIQANQAGSVVTLGYVEKLNLAAYSPGDVLWLGQTPGTFTSTKPQAPQHLVFVGVVARANNGNGIAFINTQNGYEMDELHDVKINRSGIYSGHVLIYTTGIWENTGLHTGHVSGLTGLIRDVVGGSLIGSTGIAIVYNSSNGGTIAVSGQPASISTRGLASFDPANFSVTPEGVVSITEVATGEIPDLPYATKDIIGNSGFFIYRGGLTGLWNQSTRELTLNLISGAGGANTLDQLTDVDVPSPSSGNYLHYNGSQWIVNNIRTGDITNLTEHTQDVVAASLAATSGIALLYNDTAGIITISGQRASTTSAFTGIGLAGFNSTYFSVASGIVTITGGIQTGQISNYGVTTGQITNLDEAVQDILSASITTTSGLFALYNDTAGQITLSGQRATSTDLGIAAFSSSNFTVSSGLVSISAITTGVITNYGVTTGQITNLSEAVQDIAAASLATTSGLAVIYDDTNGIITLSGQRSTNNTIGLAAFDSNNFSVSSGLVSVSAIQTGLITNLVDSIQDSIGSSGFFIYRGGLTGLWNHATQQLTISWISGKPSYTLDEITNVNAAAPNPGDVLYFDGADWVNQASTSLGFTTGQISNLAEAIQDVAAAAITTTSGLAVIYNDAAGSIVISGQRATTQNPGLAIFDSSNFTVSSGLASISAVTTGIVTNLPLAIKDTIGNSGFYIYRGGITGIWDQPTRTLTLNWISGAAAGATNLDGLTDVTLGSPTINNVLAYNGSFWLESGLTTGNIANFREEVQDSIATALSATSGIAIIYDDANNSIIVSGQRSSLTSTFTGIGLAGFNLNNFAVNSGVVSITGGIQTGQIVGYGVTTGQVSNLSEAIQDVVAASIFTTSGISSLYDDTLGTITLSGQKATTTTLGVASFSSTNFAVDGGAVTVSAIATGVVTNLSTAIRNTVISSIGINNLTGVLAAYPNSGEYLVFNGTGWTGSALLNDVINATKLPNGHEDRNTSQLGFDESTRTFSITPSGGSSFKFWSSGIKYTKTSTQSVIIPNTSGLYYFYFNRDGALTYKNVYFDFETDVHTAYVYWNANVQKAYYFADERHGTTMDWQTHEYLHRTRGAAYANGFGISAYNISGDGTSDTHAKLDIANGTFFDEDIEVIITHSATPSNNTWQQKLQGGAEIPIFYLSGDSWVKDTATQFPLKQGVNTAKYNLYSGALWTGVDLSGITYAQTGYGITWVVATNNLNSPVLGILGQANYTGLGQAEATSWTDVTLPGFPIFEFRPLYKVIYEAYTGYTNTPKAKFKSIVDLRVSQSVAGGVPATAVYDHGSLVGLLDDDHPQYIRTDGSRGFTSTVGGQDPAAPADLATQNYVVGRTNPATYTGLGVARFDSANFTVTNGLVSVSAITTGSITNYGVTTGQVTNLPEAIQDTIAASLVGYTGITAVYDDTAGTILLSGQRATTTDLGLAAFSSSNFTVASGLVSISAITTGIITNYGVTTGQITNLNEAVQDIAAAALVGYTGITVVYDDTAGTILLSGQRATNTSLGIASFDSSNFTVASGLVSISAITTGIITNYGVTTGQITNLPEAIQDTVAAALSTTSGLAVIYDDATSNIIISGQRASTTSLGLARFDSANFTVSSGLVSVSAITTGIITNYGVTTGQITNLEEAVQDIVAASLTATTGLTVVYSDTTNSIILSGQRATNTTLGIASFDAANFTVASGLVSVSAITTGIITNYGVTTGQITNLAEAVQDIAAASIVTTSGIAVIYDDTLGSITISGQRATTQNPGLAIFDSNNFTVSSGLASISAVATGTVTNLPLSTKDTIGNSGFFEYRGGLTGIWSQATRSLTLNWISGAIGGASTLDALTDVDVPTPVSGNYLHYNGTQWITNNIRTGDVTNLVNSIKDTIGNSGFFVYRGGITGLWDQPSRTLTLNWRSGAGGGGGAVVLDDLSDVEAASPSDGDILLYGGGLWTNTPIDSVAVTAIAPSPTGGSLLGGIALTGRGGVSIWADYNLNRIIVSGQTGIGSYVKQDGTVSFTSPIAGVAPTGIEDLTTKNYVDTQDLVVFNYFTANAQPTNTKLSNISNTTAAANTYILFTGTTGTTTGYISPSGQELVRIESPSGMRRAIGLPQRIWDSKIKLTRESRTLDNGILICDDTLFVPMSANTTYSIRGKAYYTSAATPDFKYAFTGVTGSEWIVLRKHVIVDTSGYNSVSVDKWPAFSGSISGLQPSSSRILTLAGNNGVGVVEWDAMVANSGSTGIFGLVWAQNTSNSAQTTVWQGSYIEWEEW